MNYRVTVRYGERRQRHHTLDVEAPDLPGALRAAAERIPSEIADTADLAEVRPAPDPDQRTYLGE
jgi:hypothetical protein